MGKPKTPQQKGGITKRSKRHLQVNDKEVQYSPELAAYICEQVSKGRTVTDIVENDGVVKNRRAIYHWLQNHPDFASCYADAQESRADRLIDEACTAIANASTRDETYKAQVLSSNYIKLAALLAPHKYSEKLLHKHEHTHQHVVVNVDLAPTEQDNDTTIEHDPDNT